MKRTIQTPATVTKTETFCDICDELITYYSKDVCYLCGRDVCYKHKVAFDTEKDYSQYSGDDIWYWTCLCNECAKPYDIYEKQINEIESQIQDLQNHREVIIEERWKVIKERKQNGSPDIQSLGSAP